MIHKSGCIRSLWPGFSVQFSLTHRCGAAGVRRTCRQELAARLRPATYRRHARHALTAGLRDRDTQACYTQTKALTGLRVWGAPSPCWVLWRHRRWSWWDTRRCSASRGFWVCRSGRLPQSQACRHMLSLILVKSKLHWCHNPSESKWLSRGTNSDVQSGGFISKLYQCRTWRMLKHFQTKEKHPHFYEHFLMSILCECTCGPALIWSQQVNINEKLSC